MSGRTGPPQLLKGRKKGRLSPSKEKGLLLIKYSKCLSIHIFVEDYRTEGYRWKK